MKNKIQILPKPSANRTEQFHKYLKPGALAKMRDSRISAKWYQLNSLSQIYVRRTPPMESSPLSTSGQSTTGEPQIDNMADDFPCLAGRVYGPLSLKRKKLAAIKPTWFPSPNSQTPTPDLSEDPITDAFNNNVAAH